MIEATRGKDTYLKSERKICDRGTLKEDKYLRRRREIRVISDWCSACI
jgi:hypothetical protein